jgi:hypothetical protein
VEADNAKEAEAKAKAEFADFRQQGYRITRVDYFDEDGRLVKYA